APTSVASLTGAPLGAASNIAAMAFDSLGSLYGVDSLSGLTHLVTINPTTGVITDLGVSLTNLDAIASRPQVSVAGVPEPTSLSLSLLGAMTLSGLAYRRKKLASAVPSGN